MRNLKRFTRRRSSCTTVVAILVAMIFLGVLPTSAASQGVPDVSAAAKPKPVRHPAEQIQVAFGQAEFPACGRTDARYYSVEKSQITADDTGFGYALRVTWWGGFVWHHADASLNFQYANLQPLTVEASNPGFRVILPMPGERSIMCVSGERQTWLVWAQRADAEAFADAVNWMIWSNSLEGKAFLDREVQSRVQQLEAWKAGTRPTMPEDAHQHQVLAENAVQEKNLKRAIDEYEAALQIFPTWPEGQFNLALVCGEMHDYPCAVEHMQNYVELAPDAPDAQAAKDKLIIWRDKVQHPAQ